MTMRLPAVVATLTLTFALAGCGAQSLVAASTAHGGYRAADESDHQQMNAIVRGVLKSHMPFLLKSADADHDGAISEGEYRGKRGAEVVELFFAQFDGNGDRRVSASEFTAALKTDKPVEAFHHFTEERMSAAIGPYAEDKDFDAADLRTYMTHDLDLTADFPQLFALMDKLDLNQDGKLLSAKGEGPAFMLTFAQPQLQHELGMPQAMPQSR